MTSVKVYANKRLQKSHETQLGPLPKKPAYDFDNDKPKPRTFNGYFIGELDFMFESFAEVKPASFPLLCIVCF
jgi:hypothetical protein